MQHPTLEVFDASQAHGHVKPQYVVRDLTYLLELDCAIGHGILHVTPFSMLIVEGRTQWFSTLCSLILN